MIPSQLVYMPMLKKGMFARQTRGSTRKGKGVGAVLLDGGLGGQSSYSGIDNYEATTGRQVVGMGSKMDMSKMSRMGKKLESLMIKPTAKKVKNINFSM